MIAAPPPVILEAPPPAGIDCSAADETTVMTLQQSPARPGATLSLRVAAGLWGGSDVPAGCLADWRTSDPAVTLSPDRRSLIIGAGATPGQTVTVSAAIGSRRVGTSVRIVGRDEVVLTGFWSQKSVECTGDRQPIEPVRELHFDDKGGYSVTFIPFETYKDYWGDFTLNAATGDLAMTYEGGNRGGADLDLSGKARLEPGGDLVLEDVYLGDRQGPSDGACRYVFGR